MPAQIITVPIRAGSDADASHRPKDPRYRLVDPPTTYLDKLGQKWMEERGEAHPFINYTLDRLPEGYELYQIARPSNPNLTDKRLFGHPSHMFFDSPNRFFPHFLHLMNNQGSNVGCPCSVCNADGRKPLALHESRSASANSSVPRRPGRPKTMDSKKSEKVDEEGTPDVYRSLLDALKRQGQIDVPIEEPMSMDWRAERTPLQTMLQRYRTQGAWLPRLGEIVLFVMSIPNGKEIVFDYDDFQYRLYDTTNDLYGDFPQWRAGIVTQVPADAHAYEVFHLVMPPPSPLGPNYAGFRVETFPDPNGDDKLAQKQYKYVPLHYTRPFAFYQEILRGVPPEHWHSSITNAMTVMSTFSLVDRFHFRGRWPQAVINCRGIYIGAELLLVGDAARLLPGTETRTGITSTDIDVLHISSIRLALTNLDRASDNDRDEGHPYNTSVEVRGTLFTTDQRAKFPDAIGLSDDDAEAPGMKDYASCTPFFRKRAGGKIVSVPFHRILGRCHDATSIQLWFPNEQRKIQAMWQQRHREAGSRDSSLDREEREKITLLHYGADGIIEARQFSSEQYRKVDRQRGKLWFWGDSRVESLDVHSMNGAPIQAFDEDRDPQKWRREIRILEGVVPGGRVRTVEEKQKLTEKTGVLRRRGRSRHDQAEGRSITNLGRNGNGGNEEEEEAFRGREGGETLNGMDGDVFESGISQGVSGQSGENAGRSGNPYIIID